jgi:hypothetical protein
MTLTHYVYVTNARKDGMIKIGRTIDPRRRLGDHRLKHGSEIKILGLFTADSKWRENAAHEAVSAWHVGHEWYNADPAIVIKRLRLVRGLRPSIVAASLNAPMRRWGAAMAADGLKVSVQQVTRVLGPSGRKPGVRQPARKRASKR